MAFVELTCRSGGSNLNPGTTSGSGEEGTTNVYAGVGDSDGTSVFTPSDGSTPASTVSAGMFGTVYVTAGAVTSGWIGRITTVAAGVNGAVTFSTTAKVGTFPAASAGAHTISMRVGGACRGPNGTDGYPLTLVADALQNVATNPPRVNLKNDQSYAITAAITGAGTASSVVIQGYTSTFNDGGKWTLSGPATGASFVLLTWGTVNQTCHDTIFSTNGDAGSADLVSGTGQHYHRCVFANGMGSGCANGVAVMSQCEAYNNNRSNTASKGGVTANSGAPSLRRCVLHHNAGSNSHGARGILDAEDCIFWANGGNGISSTGGGNRLVARRSAFYGNGGAGIAATATASVGLVENCAFCSNTGFGVDDNIAGIGAWFLRNNAFGSGTKANSGGTTRFAVRKSAIETGSVTIAANTLPWNDADNGDFRLTLAALRAAGYGAYTLTQGGYSGAANTIDQPDIGGPHVEPVLPATSVVLAGNVYGVLSALTGVYAAGAIIHGDPLNGGFDG